MKKHTLSPEQKKAKKAEYNARWRAKNKDYKRKGEKDYFSKYYQENREKITQKNKEYAKEHPRNNWGAYPPSKEARANSNKNRPYSKEKAKERAIRRRKELIALIGDRCEKCGNADWRVLQIDHINGGGTKERKIIRGKFQLQKDVLKHGRNKYQLLCANCHALKMHDK